jgi:alcohol dehydrogenase class IV
MEGWNFYMPTRIRFGWGRFQEIRQIVDELKGKKIFLVTGRNFAKKYGILDKLSNYLKGLTLMVFAEVEENPSIETVDRGAEQCRKSQCDLVIGLGGGSGLDALCQAVEGFWSTQANPVTRSLAFQAIKLAMENLEPACLRKDQESVVNMALASHLTCIEMSNIGNTSIHPLFYPITLDYGVPHGFACAIFLPAVIRFNAQAIENWFRDLLRILNLPSVEAFADKVDSFMERLKALRRLSEVGVKV